MLFVIFFNPLSMAMDVNKRLLTICYDDENVSFNKGLN